MYEKEKEKKKDLSCGICWAKKTLGNRHAEEKENPGGRYL